MIKLVDKVNKYIAEPNIITKEQFNYLYNKLVDLEKETGITLDNSPTKILKENESMENVIEIVELLTYITAKPLFSAAPPPPPALVERFSDKVEHSMYILAEEPELRTPPPYVAAFLIIEEPVRNTVPELQSPPPLAPLELEMIQLFNRKTLADGL